MKKIALKISDSFLNCDVLTHIQHVLLELKVKPQLFKISEFIDHSVFQGIILFTNLTDSESAQVDILNFYAQSKPIIVFNESAKPVARYLKKMNPVIAVAANDVDIFGLKKIGIDTEICPSDDFITDRYTKILSSSLKLTDSKLTSSEKKGLESMCKELVEMC